MNNGRRLNSMSLPFLTRRLLNIETLTRLKSVSSRALWLSVKVTYWDAKCLSQMEWSRLIISRFEHY